MDHPNKIFKYIKSLTSAPPVPPIVSFDSSTASTDSEKVLQLNSFSTLFYSECLLNSSSARISITHPYPI